MLSILIPVYNYDIRSLVAVLSKQAQQLEIEYEIFCLDDGSETNFNVLNKEIESLPAVRYEELPQNLGRSAIRNRLAEEARYPWLLFMDCDTMPEREDFLASYVAHLDHPQVLYGGRSYAPSTTDSQLYFHWLYGSNREVSTLKKRLEEPYQSFMTNNFVIPKSVLLDIRFDESLKQYGHEDTLFGLELKQGQITILHLDNPMRHVGLEEASIFLRKSEQAIENLLLLRKKYDLKEDIKLLRYFEKTKKWGLHPLIRFWFKLNKNRLKKNLFGPKPKLRVFDLYKLGYMVCINHSK